jgi:hypothetical protein
MIFEFRFKSDSRSRVAFAFVEDVADVRGEGHKAQQMFLEEALAFFGFTLRKYAPGGG